MSTETIPSVNDAIEFQHEGSPVSLPLVRGTESETAIDIRAATGALPVESRKLITLRYTEELTQRQIAARLGMSQSQVHRRLTAILDELRTLAPDDIESRLVISGFVDHPMGPDEQRCQECIYYLVHRKWCDVPEISLPAEPDWWCRLWRI